MSLGWCSTHSPRITQGALEPHPPNVSVEQQRDAFILQGRLLRRSRLPLPVKGGFRTTELGDRLELVPWRAGDARCRNRGYSDLGEPAEVEARRRQGAFPPVVPRCPPLATRNRRAPRAPLAR
eukprot:TRINITY_DN19060_c0_g1_i1.p1 TRINITY_DN19060_c0_g1~~TRINITY_DN19060_c0_g1_i1.p1  ORF type:complete len:137 (+),score=5.32 TRINITY_DN19060_c0_g1_i1:45-413(+)